MTTVDTASDPARRQLRRALLRLLAYAPLAAAATSCGGGSGTALRPPVAARSWKMGFFPTPVRMDSAAVLKGVDLFSERAEIVHIHEELPWTDLLGGMSPGAILDRDKVQFINYCRGKGLRLSFMADLTDGLSRSEEAPQLRALGRSIAEPAVQQAYRDYVKAFVTTLNPDLVGLAAETNLIRAAASAGVYSAVVQAANAAAADLHAVNVSAPLYVSVQAETAWGVLGGAGSGAYAGVEQDFIDFPFTQLLGLSSYPYFGHAQPEDIPADYFSRLLAGRNLPALVAEGGWTSASVGSVHSSADEQARHVTALAKLLDTVNAKAVVQTLFADIDLASVPVPFPPNLPLFVSLGLMDSAYAAKPALAVWDGLFARVLK